MWWWIDMAQINESPQNVFIYDKTNDTWHQMGGKVATNANYIWTGAHQFNSNVLMNGNVQVTTKFNSYNTELERDEAMPNPSEGLISYIKYDNLGNRYSQHKQSGGMNNDFDWSDWFSGQQGKKGYSNVGDMFGDQSSGGVSDFFDRIFGGGQRGFSQRPTRSRPQKGSDYKTSVTLSFEESYNGISKNLKINNERISINFKPGIKDGHELKLSGKGTAGKNGGPSGDLYIKVNVLNPEGIERDGDNITIEKFINLTSMVLGGQETIEVLGNKVSFKLQETTPSGKKLKFTGLGFKNYKTSIKGNLYVKLYPLLPTKLTTKQRKLFENLKAIE